MKKGDGMTDDKGQEGADDKGQMTEGEEPDFGRSPWDVVLAYRRCVRCDWFRKAHLHHGFWCGRHDKPTVENGHCSSWCRGHEEDGESRLAAALKGGLGA